MLHSAVWIDARDLSFSTESDGSSKVTFDLNAVTLDESLRPLDNFRQNITVNVPAAFRQTVLGDGLRARLNMGVKNPGAYEVRVAVRDQRSERIGSDAAFVDVPDLARGELALSGILIGATGEPGVAGEAIPRRFHPGQTVIVGYQILNARRDGRGNVRVGETTVLLHAGSVVATGDPTVADGKDQPDSARMLREREFSFGEDLEPGSYNLKITAIDENAPHGSDSVSQSIEVEID
jgi:hypothetical protein